MNQLYLIVSTLFFSQYVMAQQYNVHNSDLRCDQFETAIQDPSSKTGRKCVNQAFEQQKRQNEINQKMPNCDQFETVIQDPSSKTGWKCVNQALEQQKRQNSFCEPNHDLTECVTPDGFVYKLEKNINQTQRSLIPFKKKTQDILPDPQILKQATHQ